MAAFRLVSEKGWAPLHAHLFRPHLEQERRSVYGDRVSLLIAVRMASSAGPHDLTNYVSALRACERCCGMLVTQWEGLPLVSQEDVLQLIGNAVVLLGGKRPKPLKRRGGWQMSAGAAR